jgi:hypothetical protein
MTVVAGQGKRTETQYYNGAGYNTSNWTFTQHATNSTANTVKFADFSWSPNSNTTGALVYEINTKNMVAKIFTANGSGGGSWSSAVNSPTQSNNVMNVEVNGRSGANEFMACNKDNKNPQDLSCYEINSFTPTWATPVNNLLTPNTQNGSQYSIDFEYNLAGSLGLVVYSDNMSTPKYRTYSPSTNAFSAASTLSDINGILETVKVIPSPVNDDFMVLLGNASLDVFSTKYNSANNTFSNITSRAINGSAISDYWYDFVWDGM